MDKQPKTTTATGVNNLEQKTTPREFAEQNAKNAAKQSAGG